MQDFERFARCSLFVLALAGASCSGRTVVAVDPYPCADAGPNGCPPGPLDDLIGYWRLDDGPGSTTARDDSGRMNTGTLVGLDPATAWVAGGPEGTALAVQGGYVSVAPSESIQSVTDAFTVAASMYLDGTIVAYATAISRQVGDTNNQLYHLSVDDKQRPRLLLDAPDHYIELASPDVVQHGRWLHLAGTWDGTEARLYVDGVEVASGPLSSSPFKPESNPLILAGNGNDANMAVTESVPGQLADVMLYRRALPADQIAVLASGPLLGGPKSLDAGGQ